VPKQVNGYLAEDGTFFEHEPECTRYEHTKSLERLCETHELNFENFLQVLNTWHQQIKGYYNADEACQSKQTHDGPNLTPEFANDLAVGFIGEPTLLRTEDDRENIASGDKDAPGFLEQQIRRNI